MTCSRTRAEPERGPGPNPQRPRTRRAPQPHMQSPASTSRRTQACGHGSGPAPRTGPGRPEQCSASAGRRTGPAHRARPAHGCPTVAAGWPRPRAPDPACTMRAQRNTIHPASHRASPARRNPPALDPRHPTSHNASPGDTTKVIQWGSWQRSPAWTTCVRLDHLNAVGPPYFVNQEGYSGCVRVAAGGCDVHAP